VAVVMAVAEIVATAVGIVGIKEIVATGVLVVTEIEDIDQTSTQ